MAAALVINNLHCAVVGPIDLTVEAGTCAAITGPSGAGKSLFLRMIADLDPNQGDVRLGDQVRDAMPAPQWRRLASHLAAEPGWWDAKAGAHFSDDAKAEALALVDRLGLPPDVMTREVRTLSTGERQRLALVRALVRRPACLLLDEPTSALDATSVERTEALLREEMARGTMLVLVSHDSGQAGRLATCPYRLEAGRLAPA